MTSLTLYYIDWLKVECTAKHLLMMSYSFSSVTTESLQPTANQTLTTLPKWGEQNKLSFAPHKTHAMLLTKGPKYNTPDLIMANTSIKMVQDIKILGVTIDRNLTFKSHVAAQCRKATDI